MKIVNHKLQGIPFQPSPNKGGFITPKFITGHYTANWTLAGAIATLTSKTSKVSVQFVIDRDGTVVQLVECNRRAWHAGPSTFMGYNDQNSHSIGIEFINPGFFRKGKGGAILDWEGKKTVPASSLIGYDLSLEAPSSRVGGGMLIWPAYTEAQLQAGRDLIKALCDEYDILAFNTHEEIDKRGWKTDPGPSFPTGEFKAMVDRFEGRASSGTCPGEPLAEVVAKGGLNARSQPKPGASVVRILRNGTLVKVIEDIGEWSLIEIVGEKTKAWVFDKYLHHK